MIPIVFATVLLCLLMLGGLVLDPSPRKRPRQISTALTPEEVRDHQAPMIPFGYDPAWIDTHLHRVSRSIDRGAEGFPETSGVSDQPAAEEDVPPLPPPSGL